LCIKVAITHVVIIEYFVKYITELIVRL